MQISPELEAQILAMPGVVVRHAGQVEQIEQPAAKPRRRKPVELAPPSVLLAGGKLVAVVPVETASEINRKVWQARSKRTDKAWRAVSRTLGPHLILLASFAAAYHRGEALHLHFVRLGGRKVDKSNLPTATKATEDAVAFMLGADDGDKKWRPTWDQEPGGPMGVRVEIELCPV